MVRSATFAFVLAALSAGCLKAQPNKKSQLASVTQVVSNATIEIVYRRPVARGRELFGALVPYGRIWTPSADSAAVFTTSNDIDVEGQRLKKGTYAMWMVPDSTDWSVVFSSDAHVFHLSRPGVDDEVLRVKVKSQHSSDYMESLGFYFPMVDADSAVLVMQWGKTTAPLTIKAR
jgi:hypothetical protein